MADDESDNPTTRGKAIPHHPRLSAYARPELVRTMSVKPPTGQGRVRLLEIEGVDLQPCGGTHVARTGEIGLVEVSKIESKGKQNRRINLILRS